MFTDSIRRYGKNFALAASIALISLGTTSLLKAGDLDREVRMTFSGPVQIPGKTLPAGTYIFRPWYMSGNPNAMMVLDANGQKVEGIVMYLPASYKVDEPPAWGAGGGDARSDIRVEFNERKVNEPLPLGTWNYPGDPNNFTLVYPKR